MAIDRVVARVAASVLGLVLLAGCARAAADPPEITVVDAVATSGEEMIAVYAVFDNAGGADQLLTVALADQDDPVAAAVSLHATHTHDGLSRMQPVDEVPIEAEGVTVLEPGGHHVMLEGLAAPAGRGDSFDLTFTFDQSGPLTTTVQVIDGDEVLDRLDGSEVAR